MGSQWASIFRAFVRDARRASRERCSSMLHLCKCARSVELVCFPATLRSHFNLRSGTAHALTMRAARVPSRRRRRPPRYCLRAARRRRGEEPRRGAVLRLGPDIDAHAAARRHPLGRHRGRGEGACARPWRPSMLRDTGRQVGERLLGLRWAVSKTCASEWGSTRGGQPVCCNRGLACPGPRQAHPALKPELIPCP